MYGPGDVRVEDRPDPEITAPTDAIIRLAATCVCGSDLWSWRGIEPVTHPTPMGHEYVGIIEEVGSQVRALRPGQFVVGSFMASDNTCPICQAGYQSRCAHVELVGAGGAQAELLRIPLADGTLVVAARQLGADRIIVMSRREPRQKLAREFGATDIVSDRGDEGVAVVRELTGGLGAHSVIEAVGTQESMMQAIRSTRAGGHVGYVGVAHGVTLPGDELFYAEVHLLGGPAPVRRFLPRLIELIEAGTIRPGKVFDLELPLAEAAEGYRAMDERRAIKSLLRP